jgi:hypothetical protein
MTDFHHGVCLTVVFLMVLISFALAVENNDSRLAYIPKEEFVKVISGILNGVGEDVIENNDEGGGDGDGEIAADANATAQGSSVPADTKQPALSSTVRQRGAAKPPSQKNGAQRNVKSDSLYFLQKNMQQREKVYRQQYSQLYARRGSEADEREHPQTTNNLNAFDEGSDTEYFSDDEFRIGGLAT